MLGPQAMLIPANSSTAGRPKNRENDQRAHEQLHAAPGIFERLAVDMDATPNMPARIGFGPEPVNSESDDAEQKIDDSEGQQARPRDIVETERFSASLSGGIRSFMCPRFPWSNCLLH